MLEYKFREFIGWIRLFRLRLFFLRVKIWDVVERKLLLIIVGWEKLGRFLEIDGIGVRIYKVL